MYLATNKTEVNPQIAKQKTHKLIANAEEKD